MAHRRVVVTGSSGKLGRVVGADPVTHGCEEARRELGYEPQFNWSQL